MNRRSALLLAVLLLGGAVGSLAVHFARGSSVAASGGASEDSTPNRTKTARLVTKCTISFAYPDGAQRVVDLSDAANLEEIVLEPIKAAKRDPRPADYKVLGALSLTVDSGKTENYWLFIPFGHFKHEETYYVGEFPKLREVVKKRIEGKPGMDEVRRMLDFRY